MANDRLFDAEMPRWWDRTVFLIRGLSLGFLFDYLFSLVIKPEGFGTGPIIVVVLTVVMALLPSLPKAWIEQRSRIRALRDGTLRGEIERRNTDADRLH